VWMVISETNAARTSNKRATTEMGLFIALSTRFDERRVGYKSYDPREKEARQRWQWPRNIRAGPGSLP
jgi:hypothetical protein